MAGTGPVNRTPPPPPPPPPKPKLPEPVAAEAPVAKAKPATQPLSGDRRATASVDDQVHALGQDLKRVQSPAELQKLAERADGLAGKLAGSADRPDPAGGPLAKLQAEIGAATKAMARLDAVSAQLKGTPTERAGAIAEMMANNGTLTQDLAGLKPLAGSPLHDLASAAMQDASKLASPQGLADQLKADPDLSHYPSAMAANLTKLRGVPLPELQGAIDGAATKALAGATPEALGQNPALGALVGSLAKSADAGTRTRLESAVKGWADTALKRNLDGKEGEGGVKEALEGFKTDMAGLAKGGLGEAAARAAELALNDGKGAIEDTAEQGRNLWEKVTGSVSDAFGGVVGAVKDAAGFVAEGVNDLVDTTLNAGAEAAHAIDDLPVPDLIKYNPLLMPMVAAKEGLGEAASALKVAKGLAVNLAEGVITGDFQGGDPAKLALGTSDAEFKQHTVVDDPDDLDADDPAIDALSRQRLGLKASVAKSQLSPEQAKQYDDVAGALKGNVQGEDALKRLAADGKLGTDGKLLTALAAMATQPVVEGLDRKELLTQTMRAIENPVRLNQRDTNTCGGVSAQIMLATKDPAEYARLVGGLASPAGEVKMAGGDTLKRDADWQSPETGASRALPLRLMTPGLMDLAQEGPMSHDANIDDNKVFGHDVPGFLKQMIGEGNMGMGEARMAEQLLGRPYSMHLFSDVSRDKDWGELKQALADGHGPIPTGMYYRPPGDSPIQHYVAIESVKDGEVTFLNPWGKRERISEEDYKSHIFDASLPK